MNVAINKFKESLYSIFPIVIIIILLSVLGIFKIRLKELMIFLICAFTLIIGITLFSLGAEMSMTPMGDYTGTGLVKTKKISLILFFSFLMGFLVTIAEPDLLVLSSQVKTVINEYFFVISVGLGVGFFLLIAVSKIIFNKDLSMILMLNYMLLFALTSLMCVLDKSVLVPLSFDSGGVTTGPLTVPFIMAFGLGIASTLGGKNSSENSFGFIALCSIGPILVVLLSLIMSKGNISYTLHNYSMEIAYSTSVINIIIRIMLEESIKVFNAIMLILVFFLILNFLIMKIPFKRIINIIIGLFITYIGLVIFLTSASIGFVSVGFNLGSQIVKFDKNISTIFFFFIGMAVVLAEPAIHILTKQVENVTGGNISKKSMLIALSIGVGFALVISYFRIIYNFSILYCIIPGYFISLSLSLFVPPLYTAIAFDSGGVASGPLTSTFILPMLIGACNEISGSGSILQNAFGVVAIVAMMPLISIQLLGFKAILTKALIDRLSMNKIYKSDDNQIIYF